MSTLTALDWPTLLDTPTTRWYLDREPWDIPARCNWGVDCPYAVIAYVEYQVCELPGASSNPNFLDRSELVCSRHLPAVIEHATSEPLMLDTVVEVGVDPALLRLTGVDPAIAARFNDGALGVSA